MKISEWRDYKYMMGVTLVFVFLAVYVIVQGKMSQESEPSAQKLDKGDDLSVTSKSGALIGGIDRPESDVRDYRNATVTSAVRSPLKPHGFSEAIPASRNRSVSGLAAALRDREVSSRFSSFAAAAPYDSDKFKTSPQEYIETIEPGRVFGPAQPSAEVTPIRLQGPRHFEVVQGESVNLSVKCESGVPVSFLSENLGSFENGLVSCTVVSGGDGVATTKFMAAPGTIDTVRVVAASPVHSGQIIFSLNVLLSNDIGRIR